MRTSYKFDPYSIHYGVLRGKNEIPGASKMSHWLPSLLSKHKPPRVEVFMAVRQYFMLGARKGPCTNDVCSMFGLIDPVPPQIKDPPSG